MLKRMHSELAAMPRDSGRNTDLDGARLRHHAAAARDLRRSERRHRVIAARVPSVKLAYDRAVKTIEDPAARVAELTSKFQGLQQ